MFYHKILLITLFISIDLLNINCDDAKKVVEIKNSETKNTNSVDLPKELIHEHEGVSNKSSNSTQRIKARKSAIFNETSNIQTVVTPINSTNITNDSNKKVLNTTVTTSRPPKLVTEMTENKTLANNIKANVSTTTTITPPVNANADVAVKHKSREGIDKPDEIHTKIIPIKTTVIPTVTNKNLTTNASVITPALAKNDSIVNLNKTDQKLNSTNHLTSNNSSTAKDISTTSTTTTSTTPKPKKPKITYSSEDMPNNGNKNINPLGQSPNITKNNLQIIEPIEQPNVEASHEIFHNNHRDYILPIVGFIFIIPILMGFIIISYRKFNDYWSTRHYRRMDFLVDGMYND